MKTQYIKTCISCTSVFSTSWSKQKTCSFKCREVENKKRNVIRNRKIRAKDRKEGNCCVCGYSETIDVHHDWDGKTFLLCPNHHALITRGIKTLEEVLYEKHCY